MAQLAKSVDLEYLNKVRNLLFRNMLKTIQAVQTGHLGACCSSLELMTALYFGGILRFDPKNPKHPARDYVVNRGHLGPLKYNIFHLLGWLREEEMTQYREFGSRLPGHEDMDITPGIDITPNGSLGMTLSYAAGAAIGWQDAGMDNRIFCFLGDGEEQEGNVAEAARHIGNLRLKNLICVIDRNGGQLSTRLDETDSEVNLRKVWEGYGWLVIEMANGHDLELVLEAYEKAMAFSEFGPVVIIAKTIKGNGIFGARQDYCGYHVYHKSEHGEDSRAVDIESVLDELDRLDHIPYDQISYLGPPLPDQAPLRSATVDLIEIDRIPGHSLQYDVLDPFLEKLEDQLGDRLYILSADYPPRSFVYKGDGFSLKRCRYINFGLREQHMTATAHALKVVRPDSVVVILCGDAFLYRHMDQINVLAQAGTQVIIYSVQGGLSGARNGPTHQTSGQTGAILAMPGIVCEEPSSKYDVVVASNEALQRKGPTYIRIHKGSVPWKFLGYRPGRFRFAQSHLRYVDGTLITSGMVTDSVERARVRLADLAKYWNVIDVQTLSDLSGIAKWVTPNKPLVTVYNGNAEILASSVSKQLITDKVMPLSLTALGFDFGKTGSIEELMRHFGLDTESIVELCLALGHRT